MAAIVHGIGTSSLIDTPPSRFFEPGGVFNRVLMEAPYQARCSDNKTAARVRPREHAIRYPYMQINRPGMVSMSTRQMLTGSISRAITPFRPPQPPQGGGA